METIFINGFKPITSKEEKDPIESALHAEQFKFLGGEVHVKLKDELPDMKSTDVITTNSDKKKYKPQVLLYTNTVTTGIWWWKETKVVEEWCSFFAEPDNKYMFNYRRPDRGELTFNSIDEAKQAIEKFKIDMKERYEKNADNNFKKEAKIINVE